MTGPIQLRDAFFQFLDSLVVGVAVMKPEGFFLVQKIAHDFGCDRCVCSVRTALYQASLEEVK